MWAVVRCIPNKIKSSSVIDQAIQVNQNEDGPSNLHDKKQIPIIIEDIEEVQLENRPKTCEIDSITKDENNSHHSLLSESKVKFEENAAENALNCEIKLHQDHIIEENKEDGIKSINENQD